jgi:hypothetical protein
LVMIILYSLSLKIIIIYKFKNGVLIL